MRYSPGAFRFVLGVAALGLLLALRLPFMAPAVDDLDSANFHDGILDYSPPAHRPHPPGFPVFIWTAKGVAALTGSPVLALTLLSAVAGAFAVVPLFFLSRRLFGSDVALTACAIATFTPIVWFSGARPMSDATGFAAGLTALALLLSGLDRNRPHANLFWMAGAVAAGLAIGVRLQLAVLVLPLFFYGWVMRLRGLLVSPILLAGAVLAWWVPMLAYSGGLTPYLTAFRRTMMEAASWEPLLSQPSRARAIEGLRQVALMPWVTPALAAPVLALAALGLIRASSVAPRAAGLLVVMFGPYAAFTYLTQNTEATRYVIPAIPVVAALAAVGLTWVAASRRGIVAAAVAVYVVAVSFVMVPALRAYGSHPSPAIQAVQAIPRSDGRPVVSGSAVFLRYVGFAPPGVDVVSPRDGEGWRRVTEYWRRGGRAPVYFLMTPGESVRPLLAADAYVDAGRFDWPSPVRPLMTGERPNAVRMARLDAPSWFTLRRRTEPGTRRADLGLFVRADDDGYDVLVQGRSVDGAAQSVALLVEDRVRDRHAPDDQFVLQTSLQGERRYTELVLRAEGPVEVTRVLLARPSEAALFFLQGIRQDAGERDNVRWLTSDVTLVAHVPRTGTVLKLTGVLPPGRQIPTAFLASWSDTETVVVPQWSAASFTLSVRLPPAGDPWRTVTLRMVDVPDDASALQLTGVRFDDPPSDEPAWPEPAAAVAAF